MNRKEVYKIIPQMEAYDELGFEWLPFIMFTQTSNFRSSVVNTDINGFRFNNKNDTYLEDIFNSKFNGIDKQIICGGSFGFGTGATKDTNTSKEIVKE